MNFEQIKNFYKTNQLQDERIGPINKAIVDYILCLNPAGVFEFGCNNGKNLRFIESNDNSIGTWGIDLNESNLKHPNTCQGDEVSLSRMGSGLYDITFTCSVLNHIPMPQAEEIIWHLQRVASKHVVIAECTKVENHPRWFNHDYSMYGFKKIKEVEQKPTKIYTIYRYDVPSIIQ